MKDWDCQEKRSHAYRGKVDQEETHRSHEDTVILKDGNWFPVERENMEILATENHHNKEVTFEKEDEC